MTRIKPFAALAIAAIVLAACTRTSSSTAEAITTADALGSIDNTELKAAIGSTQSCQSL